MEKLNPRLLKELQKWDAEICVDDLFALVPFNLTNEEPTKKIRGLAAVSKTELRVYNDGTLVLREPMENIRSFSVLSGVGCVFAEYERRESQERILFARGDTRYVGPMGQCVKRANHYLKYHDLDFSRFQKTGGLSCPKCGKPYPRGMHTCPRCTSKKKTLGRLMALAKPEWAYILLSVLFFFATAAINSFLFINESSHILL